MTRPSELQQRIEGRIFYWHNCQNNLNLFELLEFETLIQLQDLDVNYFSNTNPFMVTPFVNLI